MKKSFKVIILSTLSLAFTIFSCTLDSKENLDNSASKEENTDTFGRAGETLTTTIPNQIVKGQSVVFRGTASATITQVQLNVGGFDLGSPVNVSIPANGYWSKTYAFSEAGNNRTLLVKGLSSSGTVLLTKTYSINVLATGTTSSTYIQNVPYFYQRANELFPFQSCQNTSIAMILKYYGVKEGKANAVANETPDKITRIYGKDLAQSVGGFQQVFNSRAAALGLSVRDSGTDAMPLATFRAKAANVVNTGNPMSVHIYTTSFGHLLNVLGFDGTHYIVHDPYGKWNGEYKAVNGYTPGATLGINVKYTKASFEAAASPDGLVWVHSYR